MKFNQSNQIARKLLANQNSNRKGAMIVLVILVIIILLVGAIFCIDVSYMHMVRAELRTATDAAARAGAETLARTQKRNDAIDSAIQIAASNTVAGKPLSLRRSDVVVGNQTIDNTGTIVFTPNLRPLNAVRVSGRRDAGSIDGSVPLFFAGIFDRNSFQPIQDATATSTVRDIALVLDRSGSMNTVIGDGETRRTALIAAVNIFLDEVEASSPNSQISLTTYSTTSTRDIALTENIDQVRTAVNALPAAGFTAIGDGLTDGSNSLVEDPKAREFAAKTIIVMTDGNHNTGPSPDVTVDTAITRGQTVHTITFSPGANQALMKNVAEATEGGIHIHADDAADLNEAFRAIARTLSVVLVD